MNRSHLISLLVGVASCGGGSADPTTPGADTVAAPDTSEGDTATGNPDTGPAEDTPVTGELDGAEDLGPLPDLLAEDLGPETKDEDLGPDTSDEDTTDTGPAITVASCAEPAPVPLVVDTLYGFTASEDFAFDELGRYVGADDNNNLVRITIDGTKTVFSPNIGGTAGMRFLPNGDMVVNDVGAGALVRVYKNGSQETILGGLEYPNGLEVDTAGMVYVAENNSSRVRRVNPDDGTFEVVGIGMAGPNGLSLSPDEKTLYCGSFGGGVVYQIPLDDDSAEVTIFGRTPGGSADDPFWSCEGMTAGDVCASTFGSSGKCKEFGGVLDCFPVNPCEDKAAGDACVTDFGEAGTCQDNAGVLGCQPASPCDELQEGDPCETPWGTPGLCKPIDAILDCVEKGPCDGLAIGTACTTVWDEAGVCEDFGDGIVYCEVPGPCDGKVAGDACVGFQNWPGTCQLSLFDPEALGCVEVNPCDGLAADAACTFGDGKAGLCKAPSWDPTGPAECQLPSPCDGKVAGDACITEFDEAAGTCEETFESLWCTALGPCAGQPDGTVCKDFGEEGVCVTTDGSSYCKAVDPCPTLGAGMPCALPFGYGGTCTDSGGTLACVLNDPCGALTDGAPCSDGFEAATCTEVGGVLKCPTGGLLTVGACQQKSDGDACVIAAKNQVITGTCKSSGSFATTCEVEVDAKAPCQDKALLDPCEMFAQWSGWLTGKCREPFDGSEGLECVSQGGGTGGGGGLDGLNVDSCGFVYVTEYTVGWVWRFSPEGGEPELAAELSSSWIPNMHFGPGVGGFDETILYVADRDQSRLFGLQTGVPGSVDAYPPAPP